MKLYLGYSYSLMDEMAASPLLPMPAGKRTYQLLRMWSGFCALVDGSGTWDDLAVAVDASNLLETLREMRVTEDPEGIVPGAKQAFDAAIAARATGECFHLVDAQPVEMALRAYEDMLLVLPARTIIRCHRKTEKGMRDALSGRVKSKSSIVEVRA